MQRVLSILVENTSGVLSHVSGLFSRRSYNIDSFSAGITTDPRYTRMTIVVSGDEQILEQIEKQVAKLEDVVSVQVLEPNDSVTRELMIVKVAVQKNEREELRSLTQNIFHGRVVDITHESMVLEITGHQEKLQSFLEMLADYQILELARTGITGLSRGSEGVTFID